MGNSPSYENLKAVKNLNTFYRVKSKEIENFKKVWQVVESDLEYYGSSFGKILFQNHPEYIKYFHYDVIPQFVQDAKIKRKFSSVCGVMSSLIVDYFNKPRQRDDILDFIAMIHKDMQLSLKDLENFLSDLLEMLLTELPMLMTTEHTVIQMNYFNGLVQKINCIMIIHRENDLKYDYKDESIFRSLCGLNKSNRPVMHGKTLDYWEARRLYWCTRVALWNTLGSDFPNATGRRIFINNLKNNDLNRTKMRKESRNMNVEKSHPQTNTSESSSSINREIVLFKYRRKQSSERVLRKHLKASQPISPMETISEDYNNTGFDPNKHFKKEIKKTDAFIQAVNVLKSSRKNTESDFYFNSVTENGSVVKTARERRRQQVRYI